MNQENGQQAPLATAAIGAFVAFSPATIDEVYRFAGMIAVVIGLMISVARFSWDYQDRREMRRDRKEARLDRGEARDDRQIEKLRQSAGLRRRTDETQTGGRRSPDDPRPSAPRPPDARPPNPSASGPPFIVPPDGCGSGPPS